MFENRSQKTTFFSAPQSVRSLVAAFLEPSIIVGTYLGLCAVFNEPVVRSDLVMCLLVFAILFPGRNRFGERPLNALVDIVSTWVGLLAILALCGYATKSLSLFEPELLLWWAGVTPGGASAGSAGSRADARIPRPPAFAVADTRRAPATQPIPVCTTGCSMPMRRVSAVWILMT